MSVGQALAELQAGMGKLALPVGYVLSYGGQAQMMAEMQRTLTMVLAFAIFFSFVVLAVQFNSLKLPSLILGCVPFCLAGMIYALFLTGLPLGATVVIGVLIVVAATVNEGVLLLTFAEELRQRKPAFSPRRRHQCRQDSAAAPGHDFFRHHLRIHPAGLKP